MNRSRIEIATIPKELPAPHFDDEATIVSARQVVPIAQAKVVERSRALLSVIPILIGAAVFGALGALAVNYYELGQRHALDSAPRSEINQQTNQPPAVQTQSAITTNSGSDSAAGALSASESSSPEWESSQTESQTDTKGVDSTAVETKAPDNQALPTKPASQTDDGSSAEPGKLIRKRRVRPPAANDGKTENPPTTKRGAGRIQEIFAGPNPQ
jgi:cytoskeletal protein RodZ